MATLLTNAKMAPELAARIEASVRGRRGQPARAWRLPRLASVLRLGAVAVVLAVTCAVVVSRRRDREALEQARAALVETAGTHAAALTADDRLAVTRAETWLARFAGPGPYEGDLVADELRAPKGLETALARPSIYVHGPIGSFESEAGVAEAAAASVKDALLVCLVEPPANRAEKTLLGKVRVAYLGGARVEQRTANVRRLDEAREGLPFLSPPWADRARAAVEMTDVDGLRRAFERAPIEQATRALKAELLVVAMDEKGDGAGPIEFDGERARDVRIGVVELASGKTLLRLRKHVDPSWITPAARIQYASGLDQCALALDVHESVHPSPVARSGP